MPPDREVEVKFRLTNPDLAQALRHWPTLAYRYPLTPVHQVTDVDTYFDTQDYLLLRTGRTLRVRRHNGETYVTTKTIDLRTPKGLHARDEVERPAPNLDPDLPLLAAEHLPDDVLAALEVGAGTALRLRPLARLLQTRNKRNLLQPDSESGDASSRLAELSIDDVTLEQPALASRKKKQAADAPAWQRAAHFVELEAELLGDTEKEDLKEVAARLRELPGLTPNDQNKLQQAVVLLAESPMLAPEALARLHVADFCRRIWGQQLALMLVNEAGVRDSEDIEYVHDMRVATRRARAAGRLYAQFFRPRNRSVRRFMQGLRQTGRLLGGVRDMDVALARLNDYAHSLPEDARDGIALLAAQWRAQRLVAHAALCTWLDSSAYSDLIVDLSRFVRRPGAAVAPFAPTPGEPPPPHQVRHTIPSMIMNRYESIRAFEVLFESRRPVPIETLHALRIECKYLRYHLEFSAVMLGAEGEQLIASLKALQEHLGDLNDAAVSAQMLLEARAAFQATADPYWEVIYERELEASGSTDDGAAAEEEQTAAATPTPNRDVWAPGIPLDAYLQQQYAAAEELVARLPADLERFLALETRRKVALALANV